MDTTAAAPAFRIPPFVPKGWLAAVTAVNGECQCHGRCGRKHTRTRSTKAPVQCPARQGVDGVNLCLTADGGVYCPRCHADITPTTAPSTAPAPDQLDLFSLLD